MPQRVQRFASPDVQGEDSWVELRPPTRGEVRQLDANVTWRDLVQRHLIRWNWVDFDGQPMPLPGEDWDRLTLAESDFLVRCVQSIYGLTEEAKAARAEHLKV